jgi:peptidoglycan hydrolase-like amidase
MLAFAIAATVRIGVFGLFHPVELDVRPARGQVLVVESGAESGAVSNGRTQILEGSAVAHLRSSAQVTTRVTTQVTGRDGGEGAFMLSVPGPGGHARIQREFHGRLEVIQRDGRLVAIVEMDRETAVASIVAAEGSDAVPMEARKAQAVVARSFLAAAIGRHKDFDFCDTTHCQFLREPPAPNSAAHRAGVETRGQMLSYQGRVIAALYSADCGGHTRTLAESEWHGESPDGYPYFAVECPVRGGAAGALSGHAVSGHQVGMCQVGAAEMARRGASFIEILRHYFPAAVMDAVLPGS